MLFTSKNRLEADLRAGVELRLDLFERIDLSALRKFLSDARFPTLLTLRKLYSEKLAGDLLNLEPPFFDLDLSLGSSTIKKWIGQYPKTKFILSYHNFDFTPSNLHQIYDEMSQFPAYTYKIATHCKSANDALRLLLFAKTHRGASAICMGTKGSFGRILGPVVGNQIDFACSDEGPQTAAGQLRVGELFDIYRYPSLNLQTALYGLIGDPVEPSFGHLYHNRVFEERRINAVYVKMSLTPDELGEFLPLAQQLGFQGLSVTMPLKEKIAPYLDGSSLTAINTLRFNQGQVSGTNTDGKGALFAIEKKFSVVGKKILLLGAGGAARAIALEAKQKNAEVMILNRTYERAERLAAEIGCQELKAMPDFYDLAINCSPTPLSIEMIPGTYAMDIVYHPKMTPFLRAAKERGCRLIFGEEMFFSQAALQTEFWLAP